MLKNLELKPNGYPGRLITVCGLDGCGKTTMLNYIAKQLEKENQIYLTKQPTPALRSSEIFRAFMDTPKHDEYNYRSLSLMAAADRLQHGHSTIEPHLAMGDIVISDRYYYSCLANLRARGYKEDAWIYEIAKNIMKPDIAFFFDVPVELAISRVRSRPHEASRYIDVALQKALREEYLAICEKCGGVLISTEQPEEMCYHQVMNEIKRSLRL